MSFLYNNKINNGGKERISYEGGFDNITYTGDVAPNTITRQWLRFYEQQNNVVSVGLFIEYDSPGVNISSFECSFDGNIPDWWNELPNDTIVSTIDTGGAFSDSLNFVRCNTYIKKIGTNFYFVVDFDNPINVKQITARFEYFTKF